LSSSEGQSIILSPVGKVQREILDPILRAIPQAFGFCARTIALLDGVDFAFDRTRVQYHSTPILKKLAMAAPPQALKVIAVTEVDLFIPILTYVYGEAQLGGKACILSTHRLRDALSPPKNQNIYLERVVKEAIHELGHTFNLRHCQDPVCIMHYCHSIKDVDRKNDQFCRYCKVLLQDELNRLEAGLQSQSQLDHP